MMPKNPAKKADAAVAEAHKAAATGVVVRVELKCKSCDRFRSVEVDESLRVEAERALESVLAIEHGHGSHNVPGLLG